MQNQQTRPYSPGESAVEPVLGIPKAPKLPTFGARRVPAAPPGRSGAGAVARAIEAGLVVHVEHPNFPGVVMTAGRSQRADGTSLYEMIAHGATSNVCSDIHDEDSSAIVIGRAFQAQVGNRRAFWAAQRKLSEVL